MTQKITTLLDALWRDYLKISPEAKVIHDLFAAQNNGKVVNDHIALRTFNLEKVSLDKIIRPFLEAGYQEGEEYHFPGRKLYAKHFEPPHAGADAPLLPKVFISELLTEQLSGKAQQVIQGLVDQVDESRLEEDLFCCSGQPWSLSLTDYEELLTESEYAAWVAAFGYRANHFTVSINHLDSHNHIHDLNDMLLQQGFALNENGGLIKGSPAVLLEQSSTIAPKVSVEFNDGSREIPGCFYEFAKRYPMQDGHLYSGFVAASADRIFSSTDTVHPDQEAMG